MMKDHSFFGSISNFFGGSRFQNSGNEHEHGLLWIKNALMYGVLTNEKISNNL
jgi:hypothetical protein